MECVRVLGCLDKVDRNSQCSKIFSQNIEIAFHTKILVLRVAGFSLFLTCLLRSRPRPFLHIHPALPRSLNQLTYWPILQITQRLFIENCWFHHLMLSRKTQSAQNATNMLRPKVPDRTQRFLHVLCSSCGLFCQTQDSTGSSPACEVTAESLLHF